MSAPLILSLETATMGGSVWLGFGAVELATRIGDPAVSQSATLLQDINDCLAEAGVKLAEVDLFACASGPGSFTGLRIGIATLKALATSLGRPAVGVPTLLAVAHAVGASPATVALLPAGRGELFAQMFSVSEDGVVTELDAAAHLSPANLIARYGGNRNLKWAGNGAQVQRELIESFAREQGIAFVADLSREQLPATRDTWELSAPEANLAKHVSAMALLLFQANAIQSPHSLKAIYVRPSDAELNQKCQ
ncbi:MAG TPA: tRNA (adenosine(37)-N6)-threonylcarbamoyltransferase complex dimerization subunit type 1 TsaB [Pyrinomonadaceae bacterium]|nr:tRNA (adenosine(37)-N6)-threonylcarbamoyltransferase complex dimerization subunit type 1 TsaB [Pyrinomonadaceae bacterium]